MSEIIIFVSATRGRNFPYRDGTNPKRPVRTIRRAFEILTKKS